MESSPLNPSQCRAVINGEDQVLVLAGAGSGKTSVLAARAAWLLRRKYATAEQVLLLSFGREAAKEMDQRVQKCTGETGMTARTFHALALHIIQQSSNKPPKISALESDAALRRQLLTDTWQQQCSQKKSFANGWRQWIEDELGWECADTEFWNDKRLVNRLAGRLEHWVSLVRTHGGSQSVMTEVAPESLRSPLVKRLRPLVPFFIPS